MLNKLFLAVLFSLVPLSASAEVYRWTDEAGNVVYSDTKPSATAQPNNSENTVNFYSPKHDAKELQAARQIESKPQVIESITNNEEADETSESSRQDCMAVYGLSCDRVDNWLKYAKEDCGGNDERCEDDAYLDKKYRPRTLAELQTIARQAAIRNNSLERKIDDFLTKKYTNYCANQAELYCRTQRDSSCAQRMTSICQDPRDLDDVFSKYGNLSQIEKQQIIAKAKTMVTDGGENQMDFDKVLSSLIDLLVSQALLGI